MDSISYTVYISRDDKPQIMVTYETYGFVMPDPLEAIQDMNSISFMFQQLLDQMEKERSN